MSNVNRINRALAVATQTRHLSIGADVIEETGAVFKSQFPGRKAIIVATASTYESIGHRATESLIKAGVECDEPFLFTDPTLHANYTFLQQLDMVICRTRAIPIAIGAGTINDLTKLCAYRNGKRYMCIATAASMDGYTSFGASMTYKGEKRDYECAAPKALLADTKIIAKAPSHLNAAGYADLFAKVTCGADWILADEFGIEKINNSVWTIIQDGLHEALANPEGVSRGDIDAVEPLVEGLILGGFAMQAFKSSRPASGAEHQFSHLWDMEKHTFEERTPSHGFKVSVGMLAVTALYEQMLATDFSNLDIQAAVDAWPEAEDMAQRVRETFQDTDFLSICITETMMKYISKDDLYAQLTILKENWGRISERLREQVMPMSEVTRRLTLVGAPSLPRQIGITRTRLRDSYFKAACIRRRFTILDVALRTNMLDTWLDGIFGKGGVWEISDFAQ